MGRKGRERRYGEGGIGKQRNEEGKARRQGEGRVRKEDKEKERVRKGDKEEQGLSEKQGNKGEEIRQDLERVLRREDGKYRGGQVNMIIIFKPSIPLSAVGQSLPGNMDCVM